MTLHTCLLLWTTWCRKRYGLWQKGILWEILPLFKLRVERAPPPREENFTLNVPGQPVISQHKRHYMRRCGYRCGFRKQDTIRVSNKLSTTASGLYNFLPSSPYLVGNKLPRIQRTGENKSHTHKVGCSSYQYIKSSLMLVWLNSPGRKPTH